MATARGTTGAVILEADLELTASGTLDFVATCPATRGQVADNRQCDNLTFAAAVHDLATLDLTATDTITFESTLDDITTVDLTATTTRFEGF
ncbi:MAG: hypothetical protein R3C12_19355 [Planctomycetaceae bacterium]